MFISSNFHDPLPDGVYLNLSEDDYFGQETRGSSDWMKLHAKKWGWWWQSPYNPRRVTPKTKAELTYGSALHAIMLEGVGAYEARFAVEPDKARFGEDLVETIPQMQKALADNGFGLQGTSKWKAPDWAAAMRMNLPRLPCWPNIKADFDASLGPVDMPGRKRAIGANDDANLRFMRDVAIEPGFPGNESVRKLFLESAEFPALAEVSVLATIDGMRRRWRFDRMFPAFDLDLKSLGNWFGRPLEWETGDIIARRGYDIQRADYFTGRCVAYELLRAGRLFGGTPEQRRWLETWPDRYPKWDWVWLFYQKPDSVAGRAPVLFPVWDDSWQIGDDGEEIPSDLRNYGANKLAKAIDFYAKCLAEFGLDRPWAKVEQLHFTDENAQPRIFLPHWVKDDEPTTAAAYEGETTQEPDANV